VKGDDHILLAPEVTKRDTEFPLPRNGGKIEVGGGIACS
jgi:hypothetical protein